MIEEIQALRVAADELLVIHVPEATYAELEEMARVIRDTAFKDRVLIFTDAFIEFKVVKK
jgi:hypothetical protein